MDYETMGAGPGTVPPALFIPHFSNLFVGSYYYKPLHFPIDVSNGACGFVQKQGKGDFEKSCLTVKQIWGWKTPAKG